MRITFVGDIMCKRNQIELLKTNGVSYDHAFQKCNRLFAKSDLVIGNLETPVAGEKYGIMKGGISFNAPIEFAYAIKKSGIDMVSAANNHCLDRGVDGLKETVYNLRKAGLEYIGIHAEPEKRYIIRELNGLKIGILAFTYGTNAFQNKVYLTPNEEYCVDLLQKQELVNLFWNRFEYSNRRSIRLLRSTLVKLKWFQMDREPYLRTYRSRKLLRIFKDTIEECKSEADLVIALLHIGGQFGEKPTDYTIKMCECARKLGVDLVIANHEHVIHGFDNEHLSDDYFCAYSLGNFLSPRGVIAEPVGKSSRNAKRPQYSIAIHVDINEGKREYAFEFCMSALDETGTITVVPVYEYLMENNDLVIYSDIQFFLNKLYQTTSKEYDIQKEYKIAAT